MIDAVISLFVQEFWKYLFLVKGNFLDKDQGAAYQNEIYLCTVLDLPVEGREIILR